MHRSKGLEYDVVIHLDSHADDGSEATLERLRTKYVASSRARDELFIVRDPKDRRRRGSKAGGRWVEQAFGRGRRPYIVRFELLPQDFRPVPLVRAVSANADLVGYAVTAHRPDSDDPRSFVEYTASIDGAGVVGKSTEEFSDFVCQHVIGGGDITADRFPPAFKGMRVSAVETMASAPDDDADSPLFVHVARIGGFARAVWRPTEEETQET
ncbi:ATP-binding domain-containing protein [Micrococcus luteus]|uniref:ATP-binding domain-containing protein n=1 Tax=Micrococcus luteus TaxID=1270 RepID=UPI0013E9002A|nr:ATP-binding domain-containing protein [Micrococcus luteus]